MPTEYIQAITSSQREALSQRNTPLERATAIKSDVLAKISAIAHTLQGSVILRSVNPDALPLLSTGAVGKNMAVHGKSSEESVLAAYIPLQASISKAGKHKSIQSIREANESNQRSREHSKTLIDSYRLQYGNARDSPEKQKAFAILESEAVITAPLCTQSGEQIYIFEDRNGLPLEEQTTRSPIYAVKDTNGGYHVINVEHSKVRDLAATEMIGFNPTPVQVFVKPSFEKDGTIQNMRPITADIDVLAYGTNRFNAGHDAYNRGNSDPMIGQGPTELQSLIRYTICPEVGRDLMSHGPEQYNLDFPQPLEYPWVVVSPVLTDNSNKSVVKLAKNEQELIQVFNQQRNITPNPHWAWERGEGGGYSINPQLREVFTVINNEIRDLSDQIKQEKDSRQKERIQQRIDQLMANKIETGKKFLSPHVSPEERQTDLQKLSLSITHTITSPPNAEQMLVTQSALQVLGRIDSNPAMLYSMQMAMHDIEQPQVQTLAHRSSLERQLVPTLANTTSASALKPLGASTTLQAYPASLPPRINSRDDAFRYIAAKVAMLSSMEPIRQQAIDVAQSSASGREYVAVQQVSRSAERHRQNVADFVRSHSGGTATATDVVQPGNSPVVDRVHGNASLGKF